MPGKNVQERLQAAIEQAEQKVAQIDKDISTSNLYQIEEGLAGVDIILDGLKRLMQEADEEIRRTRAKR